MTWFCDELRIASIRLEPGPAGPLGAHSGLTGPLPQCVLYSGRGHSPQSGRANRLFFAPWVSTSEAIAKIDAAGGRLIDIGATGNVVIALGPKQGFARGLLRQGAWLIVDGRLTAALCGIDREIV